MSRCTAGSTSASATDPAGSAWYALSEVRSVHEDADTAFVAETVALAGQQPSAEDFLHEVVQRLRAHRPAWHWVGIYLLVGDTLRLGPYVGAPTEHTSIRVGVGVCGTAVAQDTNIRLDDVRSEHNYLACSLATRSELVVLIRDGSDVVGQFDIDSDQVAAFVRQDEVFLERVAALVSPACRSARDALAR